MFESLNEFLGQILHVLCIVPYGVILQHSNDLIIGFPAIFHEETAHDTHLHKDFSPIDGALTQDANVQGVPVALREACYFRASLRGEGTGDETVEGGGSAAGQLGAVHSDET